MEVKKDTSTSSGSPSDFDSFVNEKISAEIEHLTDMNFVTIPQKFSVMYTNSEGEQVQSIKGEWNFGDGNGVAKGSDVEYIYDTKGNYIVTLIFDYRRRTYKEMFNIEISDFNLFVEVNKDKQIYLDNKNNRIVDLSKWKLVSNNEFIL